ncbi:MAG: orotidine 5'-phosphate decarboxylase / HUMPS family protein, partial [Gemmatimonadota bacterium]
REAIDRARAGTRLLAVTVLTSLGPEEFERVAGRGGRGLRESVLALARLAMEAGAHGCVASALEVADLRDALGPGPPLVVPGIRPAWSTADHAGQARMASPADAIRAGATHLVLGRAVTGAGNPLAALRRIREEIAA